MKHVKHPVVLLIVLAAVVLILFASPGHLRAEEKNASPASPKEQDAPYETPIAGEGFQTEFMGREVTVSPRDRRSTSAWSAGFQLNIPDPENRFIYPVGSLYFWRHPDEETLFRAEVAVLYNNLFYATSPDYLGPFEWIVTFRNYTLPFDVSPLVDGELLDDRQLTWGSVSAGVGLGYRVQTDPGKQENMFAVGLLVEPAYYYFSEGSDTADDYVVPKDTFVTRVRLRMRLDKVLRNLLELPHWGFAMGSDLVYAHRYDWEDWGRGGEFSGSAGENYQYLSGYVLAAGGVPFVESERHRLVGTFHGSIGDDLDRFTATRVGGGPQPMGQEYGSTDRPVLPGAALLEFYPDDYAILAAEYRFEALFFTYLSVKTSVAYLNRVELEDNADTLEREGEYYASIGAGITTGFLYGIRLQINYNYNTSVIRDGDYGGSEIVIRVSNKF